MEGENSGFLKTKINGEARIKIKSAGCSKILTAL
jgi:hypothetical protein